MSLSTAMVMLGPSVQESGYRNYIMINLHKVWNRAGIELTTPESAVTHFQLRYMARSVVVVTVTPTQTIILDQGEAIFKTSD